MRPTSGTRFITLRNSSWEKRFAEGASILVAYTFAKLICDVESQTSWLESGGQGGYQDWNNLRLDRSLASFDVPQRLVVSYVVDFPFGKGRRYLTQLSGLKQVLLGGWGMQGITTLQRGFPLHLTTTQNLMNSFGGSSRPNVVADPILSGPAESRLNQWFTTTAFAQPPAFTFGSEPRVDPVLRGDGLSQFDVSLFKNFNVDPEGKLRLQFRGEFFNVFNHPQFGMPGQSFGNAQFGQVRSQANLPRVIQFALRLRF
jgi:hypothetical protein